MKYSPKYVHILYSHYDFLKRQRTRETDGQMEGDPRWCLTPWMPTAAENGPSGGQPWGLWFLHLRNKAPTLSHPLLHSPLPTLDLQAQEAAVRSQYQDPNSGRQFRHLHHKAKCPQPKDDCTWHKPSTNWPFQQQSLWLTAFRHITAAYVFLKLLIQN